MKKEGIGREAINWEREWARTEGEFKEDRGWRGMGKGKGKERREGGEMGIVGGMN